MEDLFKRTSSIVKLKSEEQLKEIIFNPPMERIVKRFVVECSGYCGTYGQGGPAFWGLNLKATKEYPKEWLILTIWSAYDWLTVKGQWVGAHDKHYGIQKPLFSNSQGKKWDNFTPLIKGKTINSFVLNPKSMKIKIGKTIVCLDEDPTRRSNYAGLDKSLRTLFPEDDLHNAFILAPWPWVRV
jgi:hypothetical protein